jgi:alpha,alpha-trehalase
MSALPIGDYALLSDCRCAALVSRAGSVDWLCCPRFDAPAFFARILDQDAGHFSIHPAGGFEASRRYADQTIVLETTFRCATGTAVLTDALATGRGDRGHHLGAGSPGLLVRRLACTAGELDIEVSYAPRPEFGLVQPILVPVAGGLTARGGADRLLLSSPADFQVAGATATARLHLAAGQTARFALQHAQRSEPPLTAWAAREIDAWLDGTVAGWRSWSAIHQTYDGPWRDLVQHSGRVLQALTFYPTGAIVAAPTTSLPEAIGGGRNWDYRFTWVRDASLTMSALWVAACPDESSRFFAFVSDAGASQLQRGLDLQIMFGVGGERDLSERELPHLAGWRASHPVRVGNGAWTQRQLDVYGELLDLPGPGRPGRTGGSVPALHVLAGRGAGTGRGRGPGRGDVRAGGGGRQRRGPAGRGGGRGQRRDGRQLPAGVQPHRPGQRRLGHLPGRRPLSGRDRHECPGDCCGLATGEPTSCSLAAAALFSRWVTAMGAWWAMM